MAYVVLRFYGRFVYAEQFLEGKPTGRISVLAPNFNLERFGEHRPLMSIRRDFVEIDDSTLTNLPPTLRMVSDRDISEAETFVWDLAGRNVTFRAAGNATLTADGNAEIPDLATLESLRNRPATFDVMTLQAGRQRPAQTVIEAAGDGRASLAFPAVCTFVTESDASDNDPKNDREMGGLIRPADLVEFLITLPEGRDTLTIDLTAPQDGVRGVVTVRSEGTAMVSFSNLCSAIPIVKEYDFEFSQYYSLLTTKPGDDALIPKDPSQGGSGGDCDKPGHIRYEATAAATRTPGAAR